MRDERLTRRLLIAAAMSAGFAPHSVLAGSWEAIEAEARGQTVYFNAWAGSPSVNAYIVWAAGELKARHGIELVHVKIADAAEVVRRVRDEVAAGRRDGSVDLVWINGENFRAMKAQSLLFGPFAESLPNFRFVDVTGKPTTRLDFGEPVEGLESPWGMAQLTFFGDGARISHPPQSMAQLAVFAASHPGRVSYPAPPDFHGSTFLKQALLEATGDSSRLAAPVSREDFAEASAPLWNYLDALHPHLWRMGRQFPQNQAQLKQMFADGELMLAITFNPNEPANLVAAGELPSTTIAWQHAGGTIGNTHFLAIPVNARAKAGARIAANFLLSPEAQARKADPRIWGDPTVLALAKLSPAQRDLFAGAGTAGGVAMPANALPEPHADWVALIEAAWLQRYGA